MSAQRALPADTVDAKAAKAQAKKNRRAAAPGSTTGEEAARTGLPGLRDRAVALWRRRLHPVVDVISPIGWAVLGAAAACWAIGLTLHLTEIGRAHV